MQRYLMNTSYLQDQLKTIYALHKKPVNDYADLVENLNLECQALCDVIPNYRIAPTLEKEDGGGDQRKKKEVYLVQKLEHEVLTQYEHFLQLLRKFWKKPHPEQQALGSRLCAKLIGSSAPEFNHAETLLTLAIDFANSKSVRVAQPCLTALSELLDNQMISNITEHVVQALLNIVRKRSYAMNPKILHLLLHIRVAMLDMHRSDFTEEKAKDKKLKKEDRELARQMQKANARRNRAEIATKQSRIVHRIFVIYLRVIEASRSCTPIHQTKILAPTLEGLVKFAPLVNVELYHQLIEALKDLVMEEDTSITTKLHALVAVATLSQKDASGTAAEWRVDLSYFHEVLFSCLNEALSIPSAEEKSKMTRDSTEESEGEQDEVSSRGSTSSAGSLSSIAFSIADSMAQGTFVQSNSLREWTFRVGLVLRAVDLLVLTQKHLPIPRVTAFLRKIMQFILLTPPHISMALLTLCHRLVLRYPAVATVMMGGNDNLIAGKGSYNPDATQTIASNADSSFTWEVSLFTRSYHPTFRQIAEAFCKHYHKQSKLQLGQAPVVTKQLDALGPYEVMEEYNPADGDIKPPPRLPASLKMKMKAAKRARESNDEEEEEEVA